MDRHLVSDLLFGPDFARADAMSLDSGEAEMALRLAGALGFRFWYVRGHFSEGRGWLEEALAKGVEAPADTRAKARLGLGYLAYQQQDFYPAWASLEEALSLYRELGDKKGVARSLINVGWAAIYEGDEERAMVPLEEGLAAARESGDEWSVIYALNALASLATSVGEGFERAEALWEEALAWGRKLGDVHQVSAVLLNMGYAKMELGDYQGAEVLTEEALALSRKLKDTQGEAMSLLNLGITAARRGDLGRARALLEESLPSHRDLGAIRDIAENLEALAEVAGERGEVRRAARLWGAADALRQTAGALWLAFELRVHEPYLAAARSRMDEASWTEAWEEGRAMTLEEAVSYALEDDGA